jgi:hypothetical protein
MIGDELHASELWFLCQCPHHYLTAFLNEPPPAPVEQEARPRQEVAEAAVNLRRLDVPPLFKQRKAKTKAAQIKLRRKRHK